MQVASSTDTVLAYVFAKEPVPGKVKTRLSPPLDQEQAALCYRAFLTDTLERLAGTSGIEFRVAVDQCPAPFVAQLCQGLGLELHSQGSGGLGRRMARVMAAHAAEERAVMVLASDVPDLPLQIVVDAARALGQGSVVVGPGLDGGYYLIGACGAPPPVFELDVPWGGPDVLAETLARLEAAGVSPVLLPKWPDVDDYDGLRALARRLPQAADPVARQSLAALAILREQGMVL